jgi:hypothetical protein
MSRPNLPGGLPTVLARDHVEFFPLVKLEFDSGTLYLSGCDFAVDYLGQLWTSLRGLGAIDVITESPDEIPGISLTLSGVPNEAIVHAQTEKYRGRRVTVLWAFFDGDVLLVDSACWQGYIDVPVITRGPATCTIQITAENRMIDWQRPRGLIFNHADQQRILVGDNFFFGIEGMVEREIVLFQGGNDGGGDYPASNSGTVAVTPNPVAAVTAQVAPFDYAPPPRPPSTDAWSFTDFGG